jgi:hypothetical protein
MESLRNVFRLASVDLEMIDKHTMVISDVARHIERSVDRVRDLDAELQPVRTPSGARRYDPAVVERYMKQRSKRSG